MNNTFEVLKRVTVTCDHDIEVAHGDNISTTGPTGIWAICKKCGNRELVGFSGPSGDVLYESPEYQAKAKRRTELLAELEVLSRY